MLVRFCTQIFDALSAIYCLNICSLSSDSISSLFDNRFTMYDHVKLQSSSPKPIVYDKSHAYYIDPYTYDSTNISYIFNYLSSQKYARERLPLYGVVKNGKWVGDSRKATWAFPPVLFDYKMMPAGFGIRLSDCLSHSCESLHNTLLDPSYEPFSKMIVREIKLQIHVSLSNQLPHKIHYLTLGLTSGLAMPRFPPKPR
jgi:hypothetical protein